MHLTQHGRDRVEQHVHLLAEQRRDCLGRGAEGHVQHLYAGGLREQFASEMLRGAEARARERDLARIGLGGGDQFLHVLGRKVRPRHDDQAGRGDLHHRIERRLLIVAHRLVHDRRDDLPGGHDAHGVAIFVGASDRFVAEHAGGARPVLDHDRLAELFLQRRRDNAADDIAPAAGPERDDQTDGPLRPFLRHRVDRAAQQYGAGTGKNVTSREHQLSSLDPKDNPWDMWPRLRRR